MDQKKIDDFTEKELSAIIAKEKRRLKRLRRKEQDIQADMNATYRAIDMWTAMRSKLKSVEVREAK